MIHLSSMATPVGKMVMGATDSGICLFDFEFRKSIDRIRQRIETQLQDRFVIGEHPHFGILKSQIQEYFSGTRRAFDLKLHLVGSPFQQKVWQGLMQIPYGEIRSYKQQATLLGDVNAIRAVAGANGENGIAIIIPCHRVVGTNGSLTGYGGGLPKKKWLLDFEARHSDKRTQLSMFGDTDMNKLD